ncbi:MAG: serine dehydratase beta chain, partial [Oscillospiraceae bacterium]
MLGVALAKNHLYCGHKPHGARKDLYDMGISIFEIIGPIMIGPSSSHTAGMARIGMMANRIAGEEITAIHLELSPLLRTTYRGHRTDVALIGGAMGLTESDSELCNALHIAQSRGIETSVGFLPEGAQPQNSVCIHLHCISREITVLGTSVGGGSIVIRAVDGISMQVNPEAYHLLLWSAIPPVLPDGLPDCTVQSGKHAEEY